MLKRVIILHLLIIISLINTSFARFIICKDKNNNTFLTNLEYCPKGFSPEHKYNFDSPKKGSVKIDYCSDTYRKYSHLIKELKSKINRQGFNLPSTIKKYDFLFKSSFMSKVSITYIKYDAIKKKADMIVGPYASITGIEDYSLECVKEVLDNNCSSYFINYCRDGVCYVQCNLKK